MTEDLAKLFMGVFEDGAKGRVYAGDRYARRLASLLGLDAPPVGTRLVGPGGGVTVEVVAHVRDRGRTWLVYRREEGGSRCDGVLITCLPKGWRARFGKWKDANKAVQLSDGRWVTPREDDGN